MPTCRKAERREVEDAAEVVTFIKMIALKLRELIEIARKAFRKYQAVTSASVLADSGRMLAWRIRH